MKFRGPNVSTMKKQILSERKRKVSLIPFTHAHPRNALSSFLREALTTCGWNLAQPMTSFDICEGKRLRTEIQGSEI